MDAVEYLKELRRMCDTLNDDASCRCGWCEFSKAGVDCTEPDDPEEAVHIVEEWSKAHPIQTNTDKFKEVFGFEPCTDMAWAAANDEYAAELHDAEWWDAPYEAPKGGKEE